MRSDQQSEDTGSGDSGFGRSPLAGPALSGRRPWLGAKRFGCHYEPQTWQGWLLLAILRTLVVTAGLIVPNSPLCYVAVAAVIVLPRAAMAVQRRR